MEKNIFLSVIIPVHNKHEYTIVSDFRMASLYLVITILLCFLPTWINQLFVSLIPLATLLISWLLLSLVRLKTPISGATFQMKGMSYGILMMRI